MTIKHPAVEALTNPPAYPAIVREGYVEWAQSGMTLRDHFAGQAMQAALENTPRLRGDVNDGALLQAIANVSYRMADAMLAERMAVRS